jgi:epoxyqueuosine reductase
MLPKFPSMHLGKIIMKLSERKLNVLIDRIKANFGEINARGFVDSAPVLERAWAKKAGLGWTGKHSLLLSKRKGSFFFIASVIMDLKIEEDASICNRSLWKLY